jgi:hypothetical protein
VKAAGAVRGAQMILELSWMLLIRLSTVAEALGFRNSFAPDVKVSGYQSV